MSSDFIEKLWVKPDGKKICFKSYTSIKLLSLLLMFFSKLSRNDYYILCTYRVWTIVLFVLSLLYIHLLDLQRRDKYTTFWSIPSTIQFIKANLYFIHIFFYESDAWLADILIILRLDIVTNVCHKRSLLF